MIYAARHGETTWNLEGRIQGRSESFLTPKGIAQAQALGEQLKDISFDAAFCSPLARAKDTCDIILGEGSLKAVCEPALIEQDFGEVTGTIDSFMSFWNLKKPRTAKGMESLDKMERRIFPFIQKLVDEYQDKNVLVVTHQGPLFIFENFFGNAPADGDYAPLRLRGGGYRVYDAKTKKRVMQVGLSKSGLDFKG